MQWVYSDYLFQDLEQIEEWNEYGELKEQIEDTPTDDPISIRSTAPAAPAQTSTPTSRDSSRGRHISISEPPKSADRNPAAALEQTKSPMAMAMRQAGAEAAAKAGQKKTVKPMSTAAEPTERDTTAPVVEANIASPMADPSTEPGTTQGKIPAQLAAEGAKRSSVDKIAETAAAPDASGIVQFPTSTEQQVAEMRRTSSLTKAPSKLAETQTNDAAEEAAETKHEPKFEKRPKTHRGSSLSQVSVEEIKAMEKRNSIEEDPDEDAENAVEDAPAAENTAPKDEGVDGPVERTPNVKDVGATDEGEKPGRGEPAKMKSDPKDPESAGVSVGD